MFQRLNYRIYYYLYFGLVVSISVLVLGAKVNDLSCMTPCQVAICSVEVALATISASEIVLVSLTNFLNIKAKLLLAL